MIRWESQLYLILKEDDYANYDTRNYSGQIKPMQLGRGEKKRKNASKRRIGKKGNDYERFI